MKESNWQTNPELIVGFTWLSRKDVFLNVYTQYMVELTTARWRIDPDLRASGLVCSRLRVCTRVI